MINKYNPKIHHRRSIRLEGYDYTQKGLYFITICCQDRAHMFGNVLEGKMVMNDAGNMVEKWYYELQNKFPDIKPQEMIIMPNHFHCIIENVGHPVDADLRVCSDVINNHVDEKIDDDMNINNHVDEKNDNMNINNHDNNKIDDVMNFNNHNDEKFDADKITHDINELNHDLDDEHIVYEHNFYQRIEGEHKGSPLCRVIQWFKTMTTNEYIRGVKSLDWKPFNGKLWQLNYYEHIIRNDRSYQTITNYIINNPVKWDNDKLYK